MADATPQLKRKREEAAAQKRAKKQRKDEAAAALKDGRNGEPTISAVDSTPKSSQTPTPKKQSKSAPQTNGVNKDATIGTPTNAQKAKKSQAQQNGSVDDSEAQTAGATVNGNTDEVAQAEEEKPDGVANATNKAARKKAKKERKEKNKAERSDLATTETSSLVKKKKKNKKTEIWVTSPAQGGWYLPADPVFSKDEKYLIIADPKSLRVYATDTSLLVHELSENDIGLLTTYALSAVAPHLIYAAYSTGEIIMWDWVTGRKTGRWDIGTTVENMAVVAQPESEQDLVYCHEAEDGHSLTIRSLRTNRQGSAKEPKSELKQILNTSSAIRGIQVLLQGKYVIVATVDSLVVGKRVKITKTALHEFEYVWRELKFSKHITTFNVYHREKQETSNGKKAAQDQRDILDVAVGEETGLILLFEDILASFAAIESSQKGKKDRMDSAESLRPKRLHWHRDAVGSVKWSLDGKHPRIL
jgi:NET1-associated nuclear protein 1 (U3 small nucleolar RNA-associated protein 17)